MNLTWDEVDESVKKILGYLEEQAVVRASQHYTLVGIARGGLIPMAILSNKLPDLPYEIIELSSRHTGVDDENFRRMVFNAVEKLPDGPCIFIDDICDTGKTFGTLYNFIGEADDYYVCLVKKTPSNFEPDFSAIVMDVSQREEWVIFPWE